MGRVIDRFSGSKRFLSNFYPSPVVLDGCAYSTAEHAYQAAKTTDEKERRRIREAPWPGEAKKLGRRVTVRDDWEEVKVDVMRQILCLKFEPGSALAVKLLATGNAKLVEGNSWGDRFWGVCRGKGRNVLGKLLMEIREELTS